MKKLRLDMLFLLVVLVLSACSSTNEGVENKVSIIFDASQYEVVSGKNITEDELVVKLGKPTEIEEWNYETPSKSYPIRTLYYGNYEYSFNNNNLQRVTIWDEIPYNNKNDFLEMFGLKQYSNTKINDTGTYYRAYYCGVNDLWIQYDETTIIMVKISYGTVFE